MINKIRNMDPMTKSFIKAATVQTVILAAVTAATVYYAKKS